jgi:hypothetical protein
MIKSLSPYYVNIPFVSPLTGATAITYTLNLFIWNGLKNSPPAEPQYQITKENPTGSIGTDKINIARLVNDYINFKPNKSFITELNNGQNQVWVRQEVEYTTSDTDDNGVLQLAETVLCLKGYGYGLEGENPQPPDNKILIPIQDYKVNRNGIFNVPILIDETIDNSELVLISVINTSWSTFEYTFTENFTYLTLHAQVRLTSLNVWGTPTTFSGLTSPQSRIVSLSGAFQTRIFAYNEATGNVIYSNIFDYSL